MQNPEKVFFGVLHMVLAPIKRVLRGVWGELFGVSKPTQRAPKV